MDNERPHERPHPFTLLKALPWHNGLLLASESVKLLPFNHGAFGVHDKGIHDLADKLSCFEIGVLNGDKDDVALQAYLCADPDTAIRSRMGSLMQLNTERSTRLASILLDYRCLDVVSALRGGFQVAGQPERLPIPIPGKMARPPSNSITLRFKAHIAQFYKEAGHWPNMVQRGLQLLRKCEQHDRQLLPEGPTNRHDPFTTIFTSLVHRKDAIEGHKIMSNFECAAAYLCLLMKGTADLPSTISEFKEFVITTCRDANLPAESWTAFFGTMRTVHSFKLPLQFALAVSPACLFLPASLMTKDLNRVVLIQMWQGLGGRRPESLTLVEQTIWEGLYESALGLYPLSTRLRSAFRTIEAMDLAGVTYPDSEWLSGDPSFEESLEKLAPQVKSNKRANKRYLSAVENNENVFTRPTTRSVTACPNNRPAALVSYPASSERGTRRRRTDSKRAVTEVPGSPPPESSTASRSESRHARKRTVSEGPLPSTSRSETKRLKTGEKIVYDAIDLVFESIDRFQLNEVFNEDTDASIRHRYRGEVVTLWNDHAATAFTPTFHSHKELDWFNILFKAIRISSPTPNNRPQFLENPAESCFQILTEGNFAKASASNLLNLFASQNLVISRNATFPAIDFDEEGLTSFSMLEKGLLLTDFSISPNEDRTVVGTLKNLLLHGKNRTKFIMAPDIPTPNGKSPVVGLASDILAWDMTIDQPWCGRRWEMPRSALRWAEVSTANAYSKLSVSPNGFATQIEIKTGSQLLVVVRPAAFSPHTPASFTFLDQVRHLQTSNWSGLSVEAFHLKAGYVGIVQPFVPFILLSTDNTITQKCYFYATSTIRSSCYGYLHTSLTTDPSANKSQQAAHSMLRRLAQYYRLVYCGDDYFFRRKDFPHVPDILTFEGVIDVLSLCNVFELVNALSHHLSDLDRLLFIEARRVCRTIVSWMGSHLHFRGRTGAPLDIHRDIWMRYLARQVKSLQRYQDIVDCREGTSRGQALKVKLSTCFPDDHAIHAEVEHSGRAHDTFAWPIDESFVVGIREEVATVGESIKGETVDDWEFLKTWKSPDST
ncbi:hypothetical protein DFP72DRAFT_1067397 [Ephemerocybe angulata]|uniref:Uncharacterized protein n=1 Tax=Ephemerocybe angulata TaxID=980116 RepID=A0A8H6HZ35_9AGAR|nr:hypothetical protein DFP72DRAFT_1067397 [Tulosesus angulatus]